MSLFTRSFIWGLILITIGFITVFYTSTAEADHETENATFEWHHVNLWEQRFLVLYTYQSPVLKTRTVWQNCADIQLPSSKINDRAGKCSHDAQTANLPRCPEISDYRGSYYIDCDSKTTGVIAWHSDTHKDVVERFICDSGNPTPPNPNDIDNTHGIVTYSSSMEWSQCAISHVLVPLLTCPDGITKVSNTRNCPPKTNDDPDGPSNDDPDGPCDGPHYAHDINDKRKCQCEESGRIWYWKDAAWSEGRCNKPYPPPEVIIAPNCEVSGGCRTYPESDRGDRNYAKAERLCRNKGDGWSFGEGPTGCASCERCTFPDIPASLPRCAYSTSILASSNECRSCAYKYAGGSASVWQESGSCQPCSISHTSLNGKTAAKGSIYCHTCGQSGKAPNGSPWYYPNGINEADVRLYDSDIGDAGEGWAFPNCDGNPVPPSTKDGVCQDTYPIYSVFDPDCSLIPASLRGQDSESFDTDLLSSAYISDSKTSEEENRPVLKIIEGCVLSMSAAHVPV